MTNLMSIGRFAQLSGLTVKALRLYDRRGLLRPTVIDFESGYRYYSAEQLTVAQRIRLLRSVHRVPLDCRVGWSSASGTGTMIRHLQRVAPLHRRGSVRAAVSRIFSCAAGFLVSPTVLGRARVLTEAKIGSSLYGRIVKAAIRFR